MMLTGLWKQVLLDSRALASKQNVLWHSFGTQNLTKGEQKRRLKAEQKAKEKAEKEKTKEAAVKENDATGPHEKKKTSPEEDISPNEYFKLRSTSVAHLKQSKDHPYPHKFNVTTSLEDFIEKYSSLEPGQVLEDTTLNVAGRIHSIRVSGSKISRLM